MGDPVVEFVKAVQACAGNEEATALVTDSFKQCFAIQTRGDREEELAAIMSWQQDAKREIATLRELCGLTDDAPEVATEADL